MGIPLDAVVFHKFCLVHALFGGAFLSADGNGDDFHGQASFFRWVVIMKMFISHCGGKIQYLYCLRKNIFTGSGF
jgi:hypothetical protein